MDDAPNDAPRGRRWDRMTPADWGRPTGPPVQLDLFPFLDAPPADGFGTLDLFATATDTPEEDHMPAENTPQRPADGTTAPARADAATTPRNAAQRPTQPLAVRVTAAVLAAVHTAAGLNEYGSCVTAGYAVALGTDDQARVHHQMPAADLTDPDRQSSHERWAEQRDRVAAYAATLRADGFVVDERTVPTGPILLATPPEAYPCQIGVNCDRCGRVVSHDYLVHDAMTKAQRLQVARDHLNANEGWTCSPAEDVCPSCAAGAGPADDRPAGACPLCDVVKPDVWALRDHVGNVHPDDYCGLYHQQPCRYGSAGQ